MEQERRTAIRTASDATENGNTVIDSTVAMFTVCSPKSAAVFDTTVPEVMLK